MVLDGTGAPPARADLAIRGERIAAVGDLEQSQSRTVIDVSGCHVAPGFIDIHTHSDISVAYDPTQASAVAMGVTTQVTGNCGLSLGLANESKAFEMERRWLSPHGARIGWKSFDEYLRGIEQAGVATNIIPLAGHGSLRKRVMGTEARPPTVAEMETMRAEVAAAMESGAWGMSSGLEYPPSAYADVKEMSELCRVVARHGGVYATHLRNEGDTLVESVQEALDVAGHAGVPLQLSHHKAEGRRNWGKVAITLEMVTRARDAGLDVQLDQYPYTAFMTGLAIQTLPADVLRLPWDEIVGRIRDPERRKELVSRMREAHPDWDDTGDSSPWRNVQIGISRRKPDVQGRTIASLALESGCDPVDVALDLIAETSGNISAVNFAINETDIAAVMQYPWTAIGSDGVATRPDGTAGGDRVHPRAYGAFPRVLGRYVREMSVLTDAEAIHRMTGLSAARLGLADRGLVRPGYYADITVYDPDTITDRATFEEPHQFATGIHTVLVNGQQALAGGCLTAAIAGRVLRHAAS